MDWVVRLTLAVHRLRGHHLLNLRLLVFDLLIEGFSPGGERFDLLMRSANDTPTSEDSIYDTRRRYVCT